MPLSHARPADQPPVAVIDIGSNSIRMVVYAADVRAPIPVFNEKVLCGLGRDLDASGMLSRDGMQSALSALPRFIAIADAMGVARMDVLATAAVRDASNGPAFQREVEARCGLRMRVLDGREEARLSALGVVSAFPDADGVMGDLGGGSVELVDIRHGVPGAFETLPLGPVRQDERVLAKPIRAEERMAAALGSVEWIDEAAPDRPFYAVGGAWRSLARLHLAHTAYPLHVIHGYAIPGDEAQDFASFVARQSPSSLSKVQGVNRKRLDTLPYAAFLMARVLERLRASQLVFCAYGLREGCLYDWLDAERRREDPLLAACAQLSRGEASGGVDGAALARWIAGAFDDEPDEAPDGASDEASDDASGRVRAGSAARLRAAACLLSDIARFEHPDYRADHALMRVLRFPFVGVTHRERAFLAAAVAGRHSLTGDGGRAGRSVRLLLDEEDAAHARAVGLAIRLGYTLSGGMVALLAPFRLSRRDRRLVLTGPASLMHLVGEAVERRLGALAKALDLNPVVALEPDPR